MLPPFNKSKV